MESNEGGMYPCSANCIIKLIIKIMQTQVAIVPVGMGTPFSLKTGTNLLTMGCSCAVIVIISLRKNNKLCREFWGKMQKTHWIMWKFCQLTKIEKKVLWMYWTTVKWKALQSLARNLSSVKECTSFLPTLTCSPDAQTTGVFASYMHLHIKRWLFLLDRTTESDCSVSVKTILSVD